MGMTHIRLAAANQDILAGALGTHGSCALRRTRSPAARDTRARASEWIENSAQKRMNLAERKGFEPLIELLGPITV